MKSSTVLTRLAHLEAKVDAHLFGIYRNPDDGKYYRQDGNQATAGDYAKATVKTAGIAAGAFGGYKGAQAVGNRMSGMRATIPGFAEKSTAGQVIGAIGSVGKDVAGAVANSPVGKEIAYQGTRMGRYSGNVLAGAGQTLRRMFRKARA